MSHARKIESEYRLRRTADYGAAPLPEARAASLSGRSASYLWPDLQGAPVGAHRRSLAVIPAGQKWALTVMPNVAGKPVVAVRVSVGRKA